MAGTNGEPYPSDSTDVPGPGGPGETFDSFDGYRRYEEPQSDRGWSVVDVTQPHGQTTNGPGSESGTPPSPTPAAQRRPVRGGNQPRIGSTGLIAGIAVVALVAVLGALVLSWLAFTRSADNDNTEIATSAQIGEQSETTEQIQKTLRNLGLGGVLAGQRDQTIYLSGTVANENEKSLATQAASSLVADLSLDPTGIVVAGVIDGTGTIAVAPDPASTAAVVTPGTQHNALQDEVDQIVGQRPLIFDTAQSVLTETHQTSLSLVAQSILGYPGATIKIIGVSDSEGSIDSNREISLARARAVEAQLIANGVSPSQLTVEARGEEGSTGSPTNGAVERRVSFEVAPLPVSNTGGGQLRIGVVAPSAVDDLAFTQSMVDGLERIRQTRGAITVDVTPNTFGDGAVTDAIQGYADQGYDLVVIHSSGYAHLVVDIVTANPDTTFAYGTSLDNFGLPNLYSYDVRSEQGGYVLGAMAAMLSESNTVGLIGPIKGAGDGTPYLNGFARGAQAETEAKVLLDYTGTFGVAADVNNLANEYIANGADVLSASAQQFTGGTDAATDAGDVLWFGNQSDQTVVNPDLVVANSVYHWDVILSEIIAEIDSGDAIGTNKQIDLANNGLVIQYNPDYDVPDDVKQRGDQLIEDIRNGTIVVSSEDP